MPSPVRHGWEAYAHLQSPSPCAKPINPDDLVDMAIYRASSALIAFVAYAQDNHIFDDNGRPVAVDATIYRATPRERKVNKFGKAYRDDAKLWLHRDMADIVIDAALFMQKHYGWQTILYDGLRTVEGAYLVYSLATDEDLASGILAAPGLSAHNKGMAADLVMFDRDGKLVDMGGNFDHLDMETNHRNYRNLPPEVLENRRKREIAFQHAALSRGRLFAPLRREFWDERFPENEEDHWRVLESLCRCLNQPFQDIGKAMNHEEFSQSWHKLFDEKILRDTLKLAPTIALPPKRDTIIYHGDFHPLYDRDLIKSRKHITETTSFPESLLQF